MLISIRLGWEMVSEASFKTTRNNLYGFDSVYLSKCLVTCMGVQSVWWDSFLSPFRQHVNRATTSISTWFQSWFCVWWPRQYDLIYWEFEPFLEFLASFLLITYVWNLWMWLVSCMKQGMLARAHIRFQV